MSLEVGAAQGCDLEPAAGDPLVRDVRIVNRKGLHARASAKFVQTVDRFESDVTVTRSARPSRDARSWAC